MSRDSLLAQLEAMNRTERNRSMDRRTAQQMLDLLDQNVRLNVRVAEQERARMAEIERAHALAQARLREAREREQGSGVRYRLDYKRGPDGQPVLGPDGHPVLTRVAWARRSQMTPSEKSDAMSRLGEKAYLELPW
jgi:hypothetical protein